MPAQLVAHTGMDALTHAIEAYVSTANNDFTDPLAIKAIQMVCDNLEASYKGCDNAKAKMHYAQCLAGMAFSNALLGIVHSMAHKTGAVFSEGHIPHGCANAMYLPFVIQFNAPKAKSRYAEIARAIGLAGNTEDELTKALCDKVNELNTILDIPHTIKEFGINEAEFLEKLPTFSALAVGDACTGTIPREITPTVMEELFKCCYYGTDVNF